MKVAFHSYQLGDRGTEVCLYKYAKYNQETLGNESIIISTSTRPTPTLDMFQATELLRLKAAEDRDQRLKDPDAPWFIPHFVSKGLFFKNINVE